MNRRIVKVVNERDGQKVIAYVYAADSSNPDINKDFHMERLGKEPKGKVEDKRSWVLVDPINDFEKEISPDRVASMDILRSYSKVADNKTFLKSVMGESYSELPL